MRISKSNRYIQLLFVVLALVCKCSVVKAQNTNETARIDSLIVQIPAVMRSNENEAWLMIDELSKKSLAAQHQHGIIQSVFYKDWISYRHAPADTAIAKIDSALQKIKGISADTALVKFYILKGQCFVKKTQFKQALANFSIAVKIADKRHDQVTKSGVLISIGWAYMEDGKPVEAIQFFNEVLQQNPADNYENKALLLCNIASCYNTIGNFKLAEGYALKGISAARSKESNMDLANGLNILARSYYQQGKLEKAISILKEAAFHRQKVADPSMLASDYLELADLYSKNNQPLKAIVWASKAEELSMQTANSLKLEDVYRALADSYEAIGNHQKAALYLKKLLQQKDSLADDHYNKAFAEMQVQFESQKKIAENLELKKENLETKLKVSNQQRWLFVLVAGLLLLGASVIYFSKLMKSRYATRLAMQQLSQQKERTKVAIEAEEKERRRIAADLHDGVGQTLAAASLQLNKAVKNKLPLDKVDELILQAGTEVRNLSHQVTPELLLHYGLTRALEQAIEKLNDANNKTVFTLYTHIEKPLEDMMISLAIYRCFQELSTNVLKHAQASKVAVQLELQAEEVQLIMEDDGVGFNPATQLPGLGLKNIEGRILLYDGELIIDSIPGKGTTTIIKVLKPVLHTALGKSSIKTT